jgi:hypothetical protein
MYQAGLGDPGHTGSKQFQREVVAINGHLFRISEHDEESAVTQPSYFVTAAKSDSTSKRCAESLTQYTSG